MSFIFTVGGRHVEHLLSAAAGHLPDGLRQQHSSRSDRSRPRRWPTCSASRVAPSRQRWLRCSRWWRWSPYNFTLGKILLITIPSALVAIIVMAFVQNFIGKDLADDPVYQERLKAGLVAPPKSRSRRGRARAQAPQGRRPQCVPVPCWRGAGRADRVPAFQKMVPDGEGGMVAVSATIDHPDHHVHRRPADRAVHARSRRVRSRSSSLRRGYHRGPRAVGYRVARRHVRRRVQRRDRRAVEQLR